MKLVASQFDKTDDSVETFTSRNNVLNKESEKALRNLILSSKPEPSAWRNLACRLIRRDML